jgi:hypothetical protein
LNLVNLKKKTRQIQAPRTTNNDSLSDDATTPKPPRGNDHYRGTEEAVDTASVSDQAGFSDHARVSSQAGFSDHARVSSQARVSDQTSFSGHARVQNSATASNYITIEEHQVSLNMIKDLNEKYEKLNRNQAPSQEFMYNGKFF